MLPEPDAVNEGELLVFIGVERPLELVRFPPIAVMLLELLGVAIPVLYEPKPLPLLLLPTEAEGVLEPMEDDVAGEFPATLS